MTPTTHQAATSPRQDAAQHTLGTVRHFAAHQTIFAEGEPTAHFMLVIHGMVRSCSTFSDGRRFIGAFYRAGDLFGLEHNPTHIATWEAVCKTGVVVYKTPDWYDFVRTQDSFSRKIFSAMMLNAGQARAHARLLARLHAIERICYFLLECHDRAHEGMRITLEMSRLDIADYLGLTVETVSRCLARLKRDGLIGFGTSRQLDLLNIRSLRAISG